MIGETGLLEKGRGLRVLDKTFMKRVDGQGESTVFLFKE